MLLDQAVLDQDLQENAISVNRAFSVFRVELDQALSIHEATGKGVFNSPFMSIWVSDFSSSNFQAKLLPNYENDQGEGIELKANMSLNFDRLIAGFRVYSEAAQAGAWVEITVAHYSKIDSGSIAVDVGGISIASEGTTFTCAKTAEVTVAAALIVPAAENGRTATVTNKSAESVWFGEQARLNNEPDYTENCKELASGETLIWKNASGLYFRKATGGIIPIYLLMLDERP